ncbi:tRNA (guanosine(46)-N7)-methyltransferase TrmB [Geomicrobium sp. JCM 19039]|uniref:tRNA (guanosine(46)-N7)-methyltransferase TrmB n=1 Tax=Geomicrobium sp. JCM 19039 TaxID=1460636 RepID=UPI00045F4CA5|nr:tRNA (guanosine(46)-N7)-methyltransferase TrmB [Geomicrobium sp. JCM 19039]GAK12982.1 tRNA (guanine46-N7-)-methyltransferase [Geomicrobium sp. JCM 19039]
MRLRKKPGALEKLSEHPSIVIPDPEQYKGRWFEAFEGSNHRPLHVEFGTGKGQFLRDMSDRFPDVNYVGVEKYESVLVTALEKNIENHRGKVCFIHGDVREATTIFAPGEIDRIYLNFMDPWPKARHSKRRLTHKDFLEMYRTMLHENGEIHLKTDNEGLFEYSLQSFSENGYQLKNIRVNLHRNEPEDNVRTEYEEKFSTKGQPIFRTEAFLPK